MIKTAKQLKDLIRNLSKKKSADAQEIFDEIQNDSLYEKCDNVIPIWAGGNIVKRMQYCLG